MKFNTKRITSEQAMSVLCLLIATAMLWILGATIILADGPCGDCGTPTGDSWGEYINPCETPNCNSSYTCGVVFYNEGLSKGPCDYNCVSAYQCLSGTVAGDFLYGGGHCDTDCGCLVSQYFIAPFSGDFSWRGSPCTGT